MNDNIADKIRWIINNIPQETNEIEKIRWVYINLGKIISYNYKDLDFKTKVSINDNYISKYQTCIQVSDLLNEMLNSIDGISCVSVERQMDKKYFDEAHRSNVVTLSTGERIVLDLIYDLPLIQNNCQTKNFGFFDDGDINTIIISTFEDKQMDSKLGFNTDYNDNRLRELKYNLRHQDLDLLPFEERMDYIINQIKPFISNDCDFVEATNFIDNELFIDTISGFVIRHNIINPDNNERIRVYIISDAIDKVWYTYSNSERLHKSSEATVVKYISDGWFNRSGGLYNYIEKAKGR